MSKREPRLYLVDIYDSINKIEEYTKGLLFPEFSNDQMTVDAVVRNLEIIGEAAKNVPAETSEKYPSIPWEKMVSMRNKVIHEYQNVDLDILWKTIKEDLSPVKDAIKKLPEFSRK